jgi:hypothetical protein
LGKSAKLIDPLIQVDSPIGSHIDQLGLQNRIANFIQIVKENEYVHEEELIPKLYSL